MSRGICKQGSINNERFLLEVLTNIVGKFVGIKITYR